LYASGAKKAKFTFYWLISVGVDSVKKQRAGYTENCASGAPNLCRNSGRSEG